MKVICVLEDDDSIRELIQMVLETHNFKVIAFPNAKSFEAGIVDNYPNLFLLDLMLPDGNGMDICKSLKSAEDTCKLPVIIMSAHAELHKMKGADDFIAKPFDVDELVNKISKQILSSEH